MSIVRRRELITLLGGAAAASTSLWPFMTRAQRGGRIPRVGVLWHAGSAEEEAQVSHSRKLSRGVSARSRSGERAWPETGVLAAHISRKSTEMNGLERCMKLLELDGDE